MLISLAIGFTIGFICGTIVTMIVILKVDKSRDGPIIPIHKR